MKKSLLIFVIAALVLIATGLWLISMKADFKPMDLLQSGVIIMVVVFVLYIGVKRLRSTIRGEPAEDELSKKVLLKTAAWSYYISLYMWLAMIYLSDRVNLEPDQMIGAGILAMAVIFGICWMVFNFRGLRNE